MKTGIYQKVSVLAVSAFLFSSGSTMMAEDSAQPANIVANPGFEEGVKSWGIASPSSEISDNVFHGGNYSALIKCKGKVGLLHISQTLPLPPAGSKVDCSVWVKTSKPELEYMVYFDITAKKEGGDPEWFAGPSSDIQKNPNGEWKEVKFSFTFPADQTDKGGNIKKMCGLYFRLATQDKYAGDIWFDDASVVITPPAAKDTAK
ncbi:MAG: carbohydrate binding domain-containing protein [Lentisphaerota bacterium]